MNSDVIASKTLAGIFHNGTVATNAQAAFRKTGITPAHVGTVYSEPAKVMLKTAPASALTQRVRELEAQVSALQDRLATEMRRNANPTKGYGKTHTLQMPPGVPALRPRQ
jgi:hypothetical protein